MNSQFSGLMSDSVACSWGNTPLVVGRVSLISYCVKLIVFRVAVWMGMWVRMWMGIGIGAEVGIGEGVGVRGIKCEKRGYSTSIKCETGQYEFYHFPPLLPRVYGGTTLPRPEISIPSHASLHRSILLVSFQILISTSSYLHCHGTCSSVKITKQGNVYFNGQVSLIHQYDTDAYQMWMFTFAATIGSPSDDLPKGTRSTILGYLRDRYSMQRSMSAYLWYLRHVIGWPLIFSNSKRWVFVSLGFSYFIAF